MPSCENLFQQPDSSQEPYLLPGNLNKNNSQSDFQDISVNLGATTVDDTENETRQVMSNPSSEGKKPNEQNEGNTYVGVIMFLKFQNYSKEFLNLQTKISEEGNWKLEG